MVQLPAGALICVASACAVVLNVIFGGVSAVVVSLS